MGRSWPASCSPWRSPSGDGAESAGRSLWRMPDGATGLGAWLSAAERIRWQGAVRPVSIGKEGKPAKGWSSTGGREAPARIHRRKHEEEGDGARDGVPDGRRAVGVRRPRRKLWGERERGSARGVVERPGRCRAGGRGEGAPAHGGPVRAAIRQRDHQRADHHGGGGWRRVPGRGSGHHHAPRLDQRRPPRAHGGRLHASQRSDRHGHASGGHRGHHRPSGRGDPDRGRGVLR